MKKFRDSMPGSVIILSVICLLVVLALAVTNNVTAPIIKKAQEQEAANARRSVLPDADAFTEINNDQMPDKVLRAYQADNAAGYVFEVVDTGYGGEIQFIVGIDANGEFSGITILEHTETPGLGSKVTEPSYLVQYVGQTSANDIDNYTSATVSSLALKRALNSAQQGFRLLETGSLDGTTAATGEVEETTEATAEAEETTEATAEAEGTTEATAETEGTTEATAEAEGTTEATAETEGTTEATAETEGTTEATAEETTNQTKDEKGDAAA